MKNGGRGKAKDNLSQGTENSEKEGDGNIDHEIHENTRKEGFGDGWMIRFAKDGWMKPFGGMSSLREG